MSNSSIQLLATRYFSFFQKVINPDANIDDLGYESEVGVIADNMKTGNVYEYLDFLADIMETKLETDTAKYLYEKLREFL